MKKELKKSLYTILTVFVIGCNGQENKKTDLKNVNNNAEMNLSEIQQQILFQKNTPYDDYVPEKPYYTTERDLKLSFSIINEGLKNNGFKFISNEEFDKKLIEIFKLDKNSKKFNIHDNFISVFINPLDGNCQSQLKNEFKYGLTDNLFINKDNKFITPLMLLEDIIEINGNNYSVKLPQNIIARNKYLFNDSKVDLAWLLANDKDFLTQLVLYCGYDQEPQINKIVLENLYNNYSKLSPSQTERIGDLFFTKDCEGKMNIRIGLLNYVNQNTNANDNRFIYALSKYMNILYDGDINLYFEKDPSKKFTSLEKAKIVAYIASIENPSMNKFKDENPSVWNNAGTGLYNISISYPEVIEIIIKNNYFNISNMKEIIQNLTVEESIPTADPQ